MSGPTPLQQVHLLSLPVPLAAKAQQHFEELMREFTLIAAVHQHHPDHHVPARLMSLVETLVQQFGGATGAAEEQLANAIDRGDEVIDDHRLELPAAAGAASEALGGLIDEADEYCRRGRHLLTLATPADCVAYRRWYLSQVISQLQGESPVAWPESDECRRLGASA